MAHEFMLPMLLAKCSTAWLALVAVLKLVWDKEEKMGSSSR